MDVRAVKPELTDSKYYVDGEWRQVPVRYYVTRIIFWREAPPQHIGHLRGWRRWFGQHGLWHVKIERTKSR